MTHSSNPRFHIFDVDGTLTNEECFTVQQCLDATPNMKRIQDAQDAYSDSIVLIYTARRDNLVPATFEWLRKHNVRWHWFSNIKVPFMGGKYHDTDNFNNTK